MTFSWRQFSGFAAMGGVALLAAVGCLGAGGGGGDGNDCEEGEEGCSCFANDTCLASLECRSSLCVAGADSEDDDEDGTDEDETEDEASDADEETDAEGETDSDTEGDSEDSDSEDSDADGSDSGEPEGTDADETDVEATDEVDAEETEVSSETDAEMVTEDTEQPPEPVETDTPPDEPVETDAPVETDPVEETDEPPPDPVETDVEVGADEVSDPAIVDNFSSCDGSISVVAGRDGGWYTFGDDGVDITPNTDDGAEGAGIPPSGFDDSSCSAWVTGGCLDPDDACDWAGIGFVFVDGAEPYDVSGWSGLTFGYEGDDMWVQVLDENGGKFGVTVDGSPGARSQRTVYFEDMVPNEDSATSVVDLSLVTDVQFTTVVPDGFGQAIYDLELF